MNFARVQGPAPTCGRWLKCLPEVPAKGLSPAFHLQYQLPALLLKRCKAWRRLPAAPSTSVSGVVLVQVTHPTAVAMFGMLARFHSVMITVIVPAVVAPMVERVSPIT